MSAIAVGRSGQMTEDEYDRERAKLPRARRPLIGESIKEHFADGKWHRPSLIAEMIRADEAHVLDTINGMSKNRTYGCKVERKRVGTHIEFRIGG